MKKDQFYFNFINNLFFSPRYRLIEAVFSQYIIYSENKNVAIHSKEIEFD